jgi:hypothetical protein
MNSDLYSLFTTEGVPGDPKTKQGTAFVFCKACIEHNKIIAEENEYILVRQKKKSVPLKKIKRIVRDCQSHIQGCVYVPLSVKIAHNLDPRAKAI